ncbi:RNA-binding protein CP33, chloroplastic [Lactuca sativa]|uniref:RNA-binding protein CP33, chloroplastic n=1 Tax=Lactuca sativa TaxID=4236 RepID=UPI000CBCC40A|nr:RNA-binding protein CP33, chloroplastic [Lactuca sativa]
MASLESLKLSHFHLSSSPNAQLLFPTKLNLSISFPTTKAKIILKSPFYPLPLPISRKFQVFLSSAIEQEISVVEEEKLEQTEKEENKRKLFVLNLPWSFSVADIKNLFGECGTVADIEIIKREDGKRGFTFITMSSGEEAMAVIKKFDSHELLGRILKVEYAKKFKKPTPPRSPSLPGVGETRHKLFVSNLAWKVRASNLKQFFGDFNPVSTRVVFSPSGNSAGYGFVSFSSKEEADSARLALDGKELLGRAIILKFSEKSGDKSESNEEAPSEEQPAES